MTPLLVWVSLVVSAPFVVAPVVVVVVVFESVVAVSDSVVDGSVAGFVEGSLRLGEVVSF